MKRCGIRNALCGAVLGVVLSACGGGGGGDGTSAGNYAGTWDLALRQVVNDCNADVSPTFVQRALVNQDGQRVVVDLGQGVLAGTTNNEDGFEVSTSGTTSGGCQSATALVFKDASDGNANVGFAIVVRCGSATCTLGYGGGAVKASSRDLGVAGAPDAANATHALERSIQLGEGQLDDRPIETLSLEEAELMVPAGE